MSKHFNFQSHFAYIVHQMICGPFSFTPCTIPICYCGLLVPVAFFGYPLCLPESGL